MKTEMNKRFAEYTTQPTDLSEPGRRSERKKTFTAAELWFIQKQKRGFASRVAIF